ncbi:unnamed protein product, partial [Iphiclides podalirius]
MSTISVFSGSIKLFCRGSGDRCEVFLSPSSCEGTEEIFSFLCAVPTPKGDKSKHGEEVSNFARTLLPVYWSKEMLLEETGGQKDKSPANTWFSDACKMADAWKSGRGRVPSDRKPS